jgi:hypothetical protein
LTLLVFAGFAFTVFGLTDFGFAVLPGFAPVLGFTAFGFLVGIKKILALEVCSSPTYLDRGRT